MKHITLILLGLILMSAVTVSSLSNRSKEQVTIVGDDMSAISKQINTYYVSGYRITSVTAQSVSTSINSGQYVYQNYGKNHRDIKGQVLVIMEK